MLNHEIRKIEDPNKDAEATDFQKALFYMYGYCKDLQSAEEKKDQVLVHNLLKDLKFF